MDHIVGELLPTHCCRVAVKFHRAGDAIGGAAHSPGEAFWMQRRTRAKVTGFLRLGSPGVDADAA